MSTTVTQEVTKEAETVAQDVNRAADENVDSVDSNVRYMAYGARIRTVLRAGTRYVAYTSDVGEAFRPVVPPWVVTGGYAISWLYLAGDVSYESYKAHRQGPTVLEAAHFSEPARLAVFATKRAAFQSVASMLLPAFTIHTIVKQATKAFANVKNPRMKGFAPTALGLSAVPALPFIFDKPVEHLTDKAFEALEDAYFSAMTRGKAPKGDKEL